MSPPRVLADRYVLDEVIGAGGMGQVHAATDRRLGRRVAVKVLQAPAGGAARRLELEAVLAARIHHPNVVGVFDAGRDERGAPYVVMELVRGVQITRHASRASLGPRERLALVVDVCSAVHHAHQKGVVHRDIKPANVLVGEDGKPKVLDFGVARATDSDLRATTIETRAGELIGTLPYMSPEQVGGDPSAIDTRSDVYALGVLTFELLTGRLPVEVRGTSLPKAVHAIAHEQPTRLGALDRTLRGDVETIVAKAIEKEPERRYASALDLAEDLRRHLSDEPIVARPPSAIYQLAKFARRNRVLVGGIAAVFLAVTFGFVVSTYLYLAADRAWEAERLERQRAQDAEQLALDEADAVEEVSEFLVGLFASADQFDDWGGSVTARELLDEGRLRIAGTFEDRPRTRSRLQEAMGRAYANLGAFPASDELLEAALVAQRELHGDTDHLDTARCLSRLAILRMREGEFEDAESKAREAIAMTERLDPEHGSLVGLWYDVATAQIEQADFEGAAGSVERAREHLGDGPEPVNLMTIDSAVAWSRGEYDRAQELLEDVLERRRAQYEPTDPYVVEALNDLGRLLVRRARQREAEPLLREALEIREQRLPAGHPRRLASMNNLGLVLLHLGQLEEARELFTATLEDVRDRYGPASTRTITALNNMAQTAHTAGDFDAAERWFGEAIDAGRELDREYTTVHAACLNGLALVLAMRRGDGEGAEALLREALEIETEIAPDDRAMRANTVGNLAVALQVQGRFDEAEPLLLEVLEIEQELYGPSEPVASVLNNLGVMYARQGDLGRGIETLGECVAVLREAFPDGHPTIGNVLTSTGVMTMEHGDLEGALALLQEGLQVREAMLPAGHPETTDSRVALARCLMRMERFGDAEAPLVAALRELVDRGEVESSRAKSVRKDLEEIGAKLGPSAGVDR